MRCENRSNVCLPHLRISFCFAPGMCDLQRLLGTSSFCATHRAREYANRRRESDWPKANPQQPEANPKLGPPDSSLNATSRHIWLHRSDPPGDDEGQLGGGRTPGALRVPCQEPTWASMHLPRGDAIFHFIHY